MRNAAAANPDGSVLERILEAKRARLAAGEYGAAPAPSLPSDRSRFLAALSGSGRVIAEIKHRSPSAGVILEDAAGRVEEVARAYRRGGAAALSVVVERDFFGGDPSWIQRAKAASGLPVLMKDFVVDEAQLDQAVALGADAVLLIVAALDDLSLARLHEAASLRGLAVLVEAHDEAEVSRAAACGARVVGVNARDLWTFRVDLDAVASLGASLPVGTIRIAESGVRSRADVESLSRAGYGAFLVGESLLRAADPAKALRRLRGEGDTDVKICGLTRLEDVALCLEAGVDQVGINLSPLSRRRVPLETAGVLARAARPGAQVVLVFAANARAEIAEAVSTLGPDVVQFHEPPGPPTDGDWGVPAWRAVRVGTDPLPEAFLWPASRLLFDTSRRGASGGTGEKFDWGLLDGRPLRPFVLAGGLTPGNVGEAVRRVAPDGVDTASGVESSPGVKEASRLRRFVHDARTAGRES